MRLLLAEDSALLREALTALLERLGHTIAATAQTAPGLLMAFGRLTDAGEQPDLVLTDVRMPPDNSDDGLRAALDIRAMHPAQPIMVLSQYIADTYARELLTLPEGAIGYLLKDRVNRVRDFAAALETVASGGTVIDPDVVQHLLSGSRPGPLDNLTAREREVLALMADGESNADIADALTLTDAAVSKHIGSIFAKLGLGPVEDNRRVRAVLTYLQTVHL
ncbi:response regulator transcription factor [Microbacterium sp. JB110]|uniref:response regulator transcription factor n=1 Tax=Microbacterium sp. JB110 TaxID=2024477 RepID=UPI00097F5252|nr:response regulator transcription factor [Microbacterium sp. JB110]RCS61217.1 DNA-binding response regulator [Microbacterium sp. JB110]SJM69301.1 two-component system response regulator [Frigoribacterium sp. JB110]